MRTPSPALTLDQLNDLPLIDLAQRLDGLYEHSPWIVESALKHRPFVSIAQFKYCLVRVVAEAGREQQLALLRAHPELAGKAMVDKSLTAESSHEQSKAGLTHCTPAEFEKIQQLNAQYNARFGFPFILAVRGPRGTGLSKAEIISTLERRVSGHPDFELAECLRNVHRIAEIRLSDKFAYTPVQGHQVWDWQETLAQHTDAAYAGTGQLTVTYLTDAHLACARQIQADMLAAGCDSATIDAVGNVVGRYESNSHSPKALLTGSHYDTVRNAGKYDGRLGIYVPLACVQMLKSRGQRLPFALEVVAFAEEEGQRYKATFLGSSALTGDFDPAWLDQTDAEGVSMRDAMSNAGFDVGAIAAIRREPDDYFGFIEVHIEQGPVLNTLDIPLGVVTSINASVRYVGEVVGMASHAGTTPMGQRRDAAAAVAELVLLVEHLATQDADSVGTVGQLQVPDGSINVVPGRCKFSLDLRAPSDAQRDALEDKVLTGLRLICERRGLLHTLTRTMQASAAPSHAAWQKRWETAVESLGVPLHRMPSGAGHDAMKMHTILPQAMLFVRGLNSGISHNPLESTTSDDMQLAVDAFHHVLHQLAHEQDQP
jgi:N-carbamoyl-L-amino-acid hydrolase